MSILAKKQQLENEIKELQDQFTDADTPQNIKDLLKGPLENARKQLADLEELEKKEKSSNPAPAAVVKKEEQQTTKIISAAKKVVKRVKAAVNKKPSTAGGKKSLKAIVKANKELAAIYGGKTEKELKSDAGKKAMRPGSRTSASGKEYREYRGNRSDISGRSPYLAKGGTIKSDDAIAINNAVKVLTSYRNTFDRNENMYRYTNEVIDEIKKNPFDGRTNFPVSMAISYLKEYRKKTNDRELINEISSAIEGLKGADKRNPGNPNSANPLYIGSKVYIGKYRNKYFLIDIKSNERWSNSGVKTKEDAIADARANEFVLVSDKVVEWDGESQTTGGEPIFNPPADVKFAAGGSIDMSRVQTEVYPPGTGGIPGSRWYAGIRYKGFVFDSDYFDTEEEANKWVKDYDLTKIVTEENDNKAKKMFSGLLSTDYAKGGKLNSEANLRAGVEEFADELDSLIMDFDTSGDNDDDDDDFGGYEEDDNQSVIDMARTELEEILEAKTISIPKVKTVLKDLKKAQFSDAVSAEAIKRLNDEIAQLEKVLAGGKAIVHDRRSSYVIGLEQEQKFIASEKGKRLLKHYDETQIKKWFSNGWEDASLGKEKAEVYSHNSAEGIAYAAGYMAQQGVHNAFAQGGDISFNNEWFDIIADVSEKKSFGADRKYFEEIYQTAKGIGTYRQTKEFKEKIKQAIESCENEELKKALALLLADADAATEGKMMHRFRYPNPGGTSSATGELFDLYRQAYRYGESRFAKGGKLHQIDENYEAYPNFPIIIDPGTESEVHTTLNEFMNENQELPDEEMDRVKTLEPGGETYIGGGAAAEFKITRPATMQKGGQAGEKYRAEVAATGENRWSNNSMEYDTPEEAKQWLDGLSGRWFGYNLSRVVPVSTPYNQPVDMGNDELYQNYRKSYAYAKGGSTNDNEMEIAGIKHTKMQGKIPFNEMTPMGAVHPLGDVYAQGKYGYVANGYDWYQFELKDLPSLTKARNTGKYEKGGSTSPYLGDDPVWHQVGLNRPPKNFTPAAATAFKKAITELQKEKSDNKFYENASKAMTTLVELVNEILGIQNTNSGEATRVHALLQEVGIYNYKTGLLVDTGFLNSTLDNRVLKYGGALSNDDLEVLKEIWTKGSDHRKLSFEDCNNLLAIIQNKYAKGGFTKKHPALFHSKKVNVRVVQKGKEMYNEDFTDYETAKKRYDDLVTEYDYLDQGDYAYPSEDSKDFDNDSWIEIGKALKAKGGDVDEVDEIDFEEQQDEPDYENDSFINAGGRGGKYNVSFAGKFIGEADEMDEALEMIADAQTKSPNYFPTTWFVSDHGNAWPIDSDGNEIKYKSGGPIKTFADLKRKLQKGQGLKMVNYFGLTEPDPKKPGSSKLGVTRYVVKTQTNGVYLSPDKNATTGSYWEFPPASLVEVSDNGFKVYAIGERPLNEKEKEVIANRPRDEKQEHLDAMSDGNTMYYRTKNYYEKSGYGYLFNSEWQKGLYFNSNKNVIMDKSIRGPLQLEYEFVDEFSGGGRPKSALMRDRKYQSQEPWEQTYQRSSRPRHPHYAYADGGKVRTYVADEFTTDDKKYYPGYHVPSERWNGWATPLFEKDTAIQILKDFGYPHEIHGPNIEFDPNWYSDQPEEEKEMAVQVPIEISVNGKKKIVYSIGSYYWVWDEKNKDEFAEGGPIPNNYAGKTAEQVWDGWTEEQREHFLNDHGTRKFKGHAIKIWATKKYADFGNNKFDMLGHQIKESLEDHISEGQYAKGGQTHPAGIANKHKLTQQLAKEFSRILRRDLSAEEMKAIVAENKKTDDDTCATHDYLDANMSMDEAFTNIMGRQFVFFDDDKPETEKQNEEDAAIFNAAWNLAKMNDFYPNEKFANGGLSRDRKFKSQEPHEQAYKRKKDPKNPVYKKKNTPSVKKVVKKYAKK